MTDYRNREYNPSADRLKDILFGRKIVNVDMGDDPYGPEGTLTLDDGTVLRVAGNTGGCSCGAGDYALTTLNTVDNAITNVIVEERPDGDYGDGDGTYKIFVVAEDSNQHLVAQFDGSDGNGYYGTGYWISVVS